MTRIISCLLALAVLAGCSGNAGRTEAPENRAEGLRERLLAGDTSAVFVVAHRGDWRHAPENSVAAIEHSIDVGVDVVELDLQLTRDSVLIVMHDAALDRTTTGKGKVADWTLDSIRTLRLKNGCGIRTKHSVPTLEEALLPVLERTGTTRQIVMKGSKPADEVLALYGKYLDEVIYMPVVNLDRENAAELMREYVADLKPAACELLYARAEDTAMPLRMRDTLRGRALIWYNTLWDTLCGGHDDDLSLEDPDAAFGYLVDTLGARIIQTDRAEHLLDYLRRRGLHD